MSKPSMNLNEARQAMSNPDRDTLPDMPCVIIAGGQSRRFGSNKAFASFRGTRLIDSLIERIKHQTAGPIAINAQSDIGFNDMRQPLVTDQLTGRLGPLAGIHAAMKWAKQAGYDAVVTTPVDTPILPENFVEQLVASGPTSIAKYGDRLHYVHGLWPTGLTEHLARVVHQGLRSARDWAVDCQAIECEFHKQSGPDPFFNINTPEDLLKLERTQPFSPR